MTETNSTTQSEIKEVFKLAEKYLKRTEMLGEGLAFPVVNELRYAGFHIIQAISENDSAEVERHYAEARTHCRRAASDAVEIRVRFYISAFANFEDRFERTLIDASIIPSYLEDRKTIRQVQEQLNKLIPGELPDEQCWQTMSDYADTPGDIYDTWDAARPDLNKRMWQDTSRFIFNCLLLSITTLSLFAALKGCF